MKTRRPPGFVVLTCCTSLIPLFCNPAQAMEQPDPLLQNPRLTETLVDFEKRTSLSKWPYLRGHCLYETSFQNKTVGLFVEMTDSNEGWVRISHCRILYRHQFVNWPRHLRSGSYVVAATLADNPAAEDNKNGEFFHNRRLKITGIYRNSAITQEHVPTVVQHICGKYKQDDVKDRKCEGKN